MYYEHVTDLPSVVRQQLPKDALDVFVKAAAPYDDEHGALVAGWAEVSKGWRKSPVVGERWIKRKKPRTLYVHRPLLNGDEVAAWAKSQGFETTLPSDDMHVTIASSKQPFDYSELKADDAEVEVSGGYSFDRFGVEKDSVVMKFSSDALGKRWKEFIDAGASWDWGDEYVPHLTLSYNAADVDLETIEPFDGVLKFGPEVFGEVQEDWKDTITEKFDMTSNIIKVDDEQRMVYGWASVVTEKGVPVVDTQGDIIEPDELLKATTEFMEDVRMAKAMHEGGGIGQVVHSFPLTSSIAKALGIDIDKEGWIVGVKVHSDEVWESVKSGEFKSFSIGGRGVREEVE